MNGYGDQYNEIVFVVETCQNCKEHAWNTRLDEAKYEEFFKKIAAAIIDRIPNAMVMKNQIPRNYLPYDLYNNLIPNEDENTPYFQQVPRIYAFEVSYKGMLVFSKLKGRQWPNCQLVAEKCMLMVQDDAKGLDCSQYLAGNTPMKGGGYGSPSQMKEKGAFNSSMSQQRQPAQYNDYEQESLRVQEAQNPNYSQPPASKFVGQDVMCSSALPSPDALTGFPVFPPGTKSSVCRLLTRELFQQFYDVKDPYGFSFQEAIFSGCKNVDSGIGVYAGSHDSYSTFAPFFDKVIEDYHGHKKTDMHQSDKGITLNAPDFPPDEAAMIKSTRIRVGRNLAGFPLGPAQYKSSDRAEIESKVTQALSKFDGELKGKYYSLDSLSPKDRQQLIDDHFLFKEGDRFLDACGLNRDWPKNRGIYHNDNKTFLVWVNEEDQLRIISMQPGANIKQVFQRLVDAQAKIEKVAKFAYDDHLGYITSCPTNLGTAMRASVHIHLPLLSQDKAKFQAIADKYYVQIRGAHGEHTETNDGIFDISNRRRLGRSMTLLVQDMYDGVKEMITEEKKLKAMQAPAKPGMVKAGPHLKKPEDITGLPEFPAGTKSLLCKYLTKDVYDKYKGKKDKSGVSFEQMILSGSQNVDSGIGIYAGSHDSYTTFSDIFDKVIEDYHGHKKDGKHISNMDHKQLKCPPFPADEAAMIVSTRIRVGRNLAEFPLGPGVTKDQRDKIEKTVSEALKKLTGEHAGTYYSLATMKPEEQKQLIEDHFLFKEGDRFLESCGLNRDWPSGRGIYHNKDKTFLVWINEEDQLRIISMQKGADIGAVFTRLSIGAAAIEKVAKFANDTHLGYITSCPTNLGTAMRGSVHIKLPLLGSKENKAQFQKIADEYYVQIRGIHGEHSETDDGVFDISNRRRLGRAEVDLVQDMYNGVKAMIAAEKKLQASAPKPAAGSCKAGPHLKKPEDITGLPEFPAGTKSLLCKYLTKDVYAKYKGKKDKSGVSFEQMILSGSQNVDSGIGIYAGSHDSYTTFSDIFDKVIEDYHGHKKDGKHISNMDHKQLKCPPFSPEDAARIVSTRIRVGRNLAAFPLGPGVTKEQRDEIERTVSEALKKLTGEHAGTYYSLATMKPEEQKQLIADHFLFKEGDRFLESCGLNRDWPSGRGIYHNKDKTFLVWINEEDQLRIISMQKGADIGAVFTRLSIGAAEIEKVAKFANDTHLGYITSCPTNLGTAMRGSVHIKLPLLGSKENKAQFQKIADEYYVQIRGIHGEHSETDDGIFDISNRRRLGRAEVDLVQDMYNGVKAMIEAEKKLEAAAPKGSAPKAAAGSCKAGPHLKKPEDITGLPEFPAGTKSLLCKYLTKDVYEKYKGKKDKCGVSFEQMILSGSQNVDSGIGIYAGSHDSYTTFSDIFDKVIEDYHGHKKDGKHISNMDHKQLKCPPFSPEDAARIVSTRIRVGRNLAEFPLGPGVTKDQRDKIEKTVSEALKKLTGEHAGTYYSLATMKPEEQKQLIADHFLFKEGDRFLESCGLNRDWPSGRGIYHNKDKTFLVWINEEDQLRIISMQKGADIGAVFTRLSIGAAEIEKVAKFANDTHLGYITSCPTNLGTAMRGSVHIKLPLLGSKENKAQFQKIADEYYVQIRGIHGEHSETDDGIFDISNRRRLGRAEVDLVQDMYNGVKAMIEAEKKLEAAAPKDSAPKAAAGSCKAGPHLKKPEDITGLPEFPAGTKSLLCKYLTKDVYEKYKGKKDKAGVSFEQMILSGSQNVDSGIGIYAGSHDSYTTFSDIFDKVIEDYHGHKKDGKHISNMDHKQLKCPPFPADEAAMIVSTRIRVGRNLAEFPLGPGVTKDQRDKIEKTVSEALKKLTGEHAGTYYSLSTMKPEEQKQLIEDHFLFKEGDRFLESCGLNRDWPSGRGIYHNKDKTFLVWINEEDQLRIISMQKGADIGAVFSRLAIGAAEIEKVAKFANDTHLGYITSCPTNLGTAMRGSVHIKLPNLGAKANKAKFDEIAAKYYVQIRGIHGEHSETDDGVFDISNRRRLGRAEVDLVQDMYDGVKAMIAAEKELAKAKK